MARLGSLRTMATPWPSWCSFQLDHLLVENIAVRPAAQGRGAGSQLLALAEEQARELGYAEIRLYTHEAMTENIAYYPRRGYAETHRGGQDGYRRGFFPQQLNDQTLPLPRAPAARAGGGGG